jgi:hypothetical protein
VLNQFATAPNIAKGAPKMELKLIIGAALALTLGGCVSSSKALRNTSGEIITCKASGFGWFGAPVALISRNDCLKKSTAGVLCLGRRSQFAQGGGVRS